MANRKYKTIKQLNDMIDRLEKHVMYENIEGEEIYFKSPTRKSIAGDYGAVLDNKGRFISYEEAKEYQESVGFDYTKEQYTKSIQEFQESNLYNQIKYSGRYTYAREHASNVLNNEIDRLRQSIKTEKDIKEIDKKKDLIKAINKIKRLGIKEQLKLIDAAGYQAADARKEAKDANEKYNSNTFYDYLIKEYQSNYPNEDE